MTQWYAVFRSEDGKLIDFVNALKKAKLLDYVELMDGYGKKRRRIAFEELLTLDRIGNVELGWCVFSNLYSSEIKDVKPNTRFTTISIVGADTGLNKDIYEIIKLAGATLEPYEFEVVCEEDGTKPIYKGKWSLDTFNQKILPKIEFAKKTK